MHQFVSNYLLEKTFSSRQWDGRSFLTGSALIPNFPFQPSCSPMNSWWGLKIKRFLTKLTVFEDDKITLNRMKNLLLEITARIQSWESINGKRLSQKSASLKILAGGLFFTKNIGGWAGHMPYISDPAWPNLTAANHLPSIQRRKNVKTPQKSTQTICL